MISCHNWRTLHLLLRFIFVINLSSSWFVFRGGCHMLSQWVEIVSTIYMKIISIIMFPQCQNSHDFWPRLFLCCQLRFRSKDKTVRGDGTANSSSWLWNTDLAQWPRPRAPAVLCAEWCTDISSVCKDHGVLILRDSGEHGQAKVAVRK